MVVNLFNNQSGAKTINGTWTLDPSSVTPAPAPPGVYNGTIDLTGYADGNYVYGYTSTLSGKTDYKTLTIKYVTPSARLNETCDNAVTIPYSPVIAGGQGTGGLSQQYNNTNCEGLLAPAASLVALPTNWAAASYTGDLWYKLEINVDSTIVVTVRGSDHDESMKNPAGAIYTGCASTLITSSHASGNTLNLTWTHTGISAMTYYIRIASEVGDEGLFNISVIITSL